MTERLQEISEKLYIAICVVLICLYSVDIAVIAVDESIKVICGLLFIAAGVTYLVLRERSKNDRRTERTSAAD